jgi:hypothetical protein
MLGEVVYTIGLPFAPINLKLALGNAISDKKIACHLLMTVFV